MGHERAVQTRLEGKRLLRPAAIAAKPDDVQRKQISRVTGRRGVRRS